MGSHVCPIFETNKHQSITYDTSMNSPGFGLSCDMEIISKHIFYQVHFFQAVFQEDKTSSEEKDYITLLRSVSAFK